MADSRIDLHAEAVGAVADQAEGHTVADRKVLGIVEYMNFVDIAVVTAVYSLVRYSSNSCQAGAALAHR